MARIPTASFSNRLSSDVSRRPAQSVDQAGLQAKALQNLGSGVASLSKPLLELENQRIKADGDSLLTQEQTTNSKAFSEDIKVANETFSNTDHDGYEERVLDRMNKRRDDALGRAKSNYAKEQVSRYYDREITDAEIRLKAYSKKQAASFYKQLEKESTIARANSILENPDARATAVAITDKISEIQRSENVALADKPETMKQSAEMLASTYFDGLLLQKGAGLTEGLSTLEGKNEHDVVLKALPIQKRKQYISKFNSAIKQEGDRSLRKLSNNLANVVSRSNPSVQGMTPLNERELKEMDNSLKKMEALPLGNKAKITALREVIQDTFETSQINSVMQSTPLPEFGKIEKAINDQVPGLRTRGDVKQNMKMKKLVKDYLQKAKNDPGQLIKESDPSLKEGTQEFYDAQTVKGVVNPKYYSNDREADLVGVFKSAPNAQKEFREFMAGAKDQVDFDAKKSWFLDIGTRDNKMSKYTVAAITDNPFMSTLALNVNTKEVNINYAATPSPKSDSQINELISQETDELNKAFGGPQYSGLKSQINTMMKNRYKQLVSDGEDSSGAMEQATAEIIGNNFQIANIGDSFIPLFGKRFNHKEAKEVMETFIRTYDNFNSNVTVRDLDFDYTANIDPTDKNPITSIGSKQEFLDSIADRNPVFVLGRDGKSLAIEYGRRNKPGRQRLMTKEKGMSGEVKYMEYNIPFEDVFKGKYQEALKIEVDEAFAPVKSIRTGDL